ncbi:MAG: hypothetical protein U1F29_15995 [Planctomycetota bacterium]
MPDDFPEMAWSVRPCTFERDALSELLPGWTVESSSASAVQIEFTRAGRAVVRAFDGRRAGAPWRVVSLAVDPGTSRLLFVRRKDRHRVAFVWTLPDGRSCVREWEFPPMTSIAWDGEGAADELYARSDWWARHRAGEEAVVQLLSWNGTDSADLARLELEGYDGLNLPARLSAAERHERGIDRPIARWPKPVWAVSVAFEEYASLDAPTELTAAQRAAVDVLWRDSWPLYPKSHVGDVTASGWRAQPCRFRNRGLAELFPWWSGATDPAQACELEFAREGIADLRALDERIPSYVWSSVHAAVGRGVTRLAWATRADRTRVGLVWTLADGATFVREFDVPPGSIPSASERDPDRLHIDDWSLAEPGPNERLLQLWSWNGNLSSSLARAWIQGEEGGMVPTVSEAERRERGITGPPESWPKPVWSVRFAFVANSER